MPEVFDLVQERLKKQFPYQAKLRDGSIFSNKLICGDCEDFWSTRSDITERYNVWYYNQKYSGLEKCPSPILREVKIERAFEMLLAEIGQDISHCRTMEETC